MNEISVSSIFAQIREAVASPDPIEAISSYTASVDWSGFRGETPVSAILGRLELLATASSEGDIDRSEFVREIQQIANSTATSVSAAR